MTQTLIIVDTCGSGNYYMTSRSGCDIHYVLKSIKQSRVKSGNFGHQVNLDIRLRTVEIQMRWLFTVCLVNLFFHSSNKNIKQRMSLSEFT